MPPKEAAAEKKPAKGFGGTGEKEKKEDDADAELDAETLKNKKLLRATADDNFDLDHAEREARRSRVFPGGLFGRRAAVERRVLVQL